MRTFISFAALFLSILLVQLGSGSLGPLDALSGVALGWSTADIGLMGSAHFAGFFIGCWLMPRLIGEVGHSRAFAAAAAIGAVGVILHPVLEGPLAWAGLRVLSGISISGAYSAIESWLQAKIERHNRGRVFGIYRGVDLTGSIFAQAVIAVIEPASYVSYNIIAIFVCLSLVPLALTRQVPPAIDHPPRLAPVWAFGVSPLACVGIIVGGATSSAFRMVGPLFGSERGLNQTEVALFLVSAVIGAALAQYPIGWLADKVDRRQVLVGLSLAAIAVCAPVVMMRPDADVFWLYLLSAGFGASSITIYSVAAAHANDFCPDDYVVELNASLIFFFSVGAIVSPLLSAELIDQLGARGLFIFIAAVHLFLILYSGYRMTRRRAGPPVTPYRYLPRTSLLLARLWRRSSEDAADIKEKDP